VFVANLSVGNRRLARRCDRLGCTVKKAALVLVLLVGCAVGPRRSPRGADALASPIKIDCAEQRPMRVRFYDAGQANAALVELPDGRAVLVDAGGDPRQLVRKVRTDLGNRPLALLWITHPHADHIGAAKKILKHFPVGVYVDNGRDVETCRWWWSRCPAKAARKEAARHGARVATVSPRTPDVPFDANGTALQVSAVVPPEWPRSCVDGNANNCSVGLRIDYCDSSVLFLGDAEAEELRAFATIRPATLLLVPHHGSETSTSAKALEAIRPRYAVVSGAEQRRYCHPTAGAVRRLNAALSSPSTSTMRASSSRSADGTCSWTDVPRPDGLWSTAVDGDVVLVTTGDGKFRRE
jgi:competence protein ComEC